MTDETKDQRVRGMTTHEALQLAVLCTRSPHGTPQDWRRRGGL